MLLEDRVVLVSGIGPGLGRANAVVCAQHGADVVLAARTPERLEEVAKEVRQLGRRALPVPTDVSKDEDCAAVVARAVEEFGRLDGIVNNAFVMPPFERLAEQSIDTIRESFEVNLFAALRLAREAAPVMREQGGGSIVMILSAILRQNLPDYGAYKMAKHALLGLARSLAAEMGPDGIRVNSVAPSYVGDATARLVARLSAATTETSEEDAYRGILDTTMLKRVAEPEEIAESVVYLLSDLSRVVTGQCIDVNCGQFAH